MIAFDYVVIGAGSAAAAAVRCQRIPPPGCCSSRRVARGRDLNVQIPDRTPGSA